MTVLYRASKHCCHSTTTSTCEGTEDMHVSPYMPVPSSLCRCLNMRCEVAARCFRRRVPPLRRPSSATLATVYSTAGAKTVTTATVLRDITADGDRPKGKRWENVESWVMFSDLHVSVKTLDVCISVLRKIKREAAARKAGILFLGNSVMPKLSSHTSSSSSVSTVCPADPTHVLTVAHTPHSLCHHGTEHK